MATNYTESPFYKSTASQEANFEDPYIGRQALDLEKQGYNIGRFYESGGKQSGLGMESQRERYLNQQRNYQYGRDPFAADEAVAAARATSGQYAGQLTDASTGALDRGYQLQQRANPIANYNLSQQSRGDQQSAINALMAAGQAPEGPSAAQAQLTAGTNQAMAQQLALARSGRGAGESASAMRGAAFNQAGIGQNMANQSAMLRANEDQAFRQRQLQAFGAAGGLATDVRGADVGQSQFDVDALLRSRQVNDAAGLGYTQAGLQGYGTAGQTAMSGEELANLIRAQQLEGSTGYETNLTNYMIGKQAQDGGADWQDYAQAGTEVGGVILTTASDIRAKQDIQQLGPGAGRGLISNYQLGAGQQAGGQQMAAGRFAARGAPAGQQQGQVQRQQQMQQAAGAALSDRRAKEAAFQAGVEEGLGSVGDAALETVKEAPGYSYQYRDPDAVGATPGTHYGPMAQDLENTPMGSSVVSTGEDGMKRVDTNRLALINTAALNAQQKEIDKLKKKRRAA